MRNSLSFVVGLMAVGVASAQPRPASPYNTISTAPEYSSMAADSLDGPPQTLPVSRPQYTPRFQRMQQQPTQYQQVIPVQGPIEGEPVPVPNGHTIPQSIPQSIPQPLPQSVPQGTPGPFVQEMMPNAACNTCQPCQPRCVPCGPPGHVWFRGEFLYWSTNGFNIPPLVTRSPDGTPREQAGVIGTPGTTVIYGNQNVNSDLRPGFRGTAGFWLDECHRIGVEGSFFFLQDSSDDFIANSNGTPIFSRPFQNATRGFVNDAQLVAFRGLGASDAELVTFPGVLSGGVTVHSESELLGGNLNAIHNLCCDCNSRIDLLYGYRFLRLNESLNIREDLLVTQIGGPVPQGTVIVVQDGFKTTNEFHGALVGLSGEWWNGKVFFGARGAIAFGQTQSTTTITGQTTITTPGGVPVVSQNGLLAQRTNIGTYDTDRFAVVPEVGVRLGTQVTDHLRVYAGYDVMYWSSVMRPGDQIDTVVNTTQIAPGTLVGPARPMFQNQVTDLWLQGLTVGFEVRY